MLFLIGAKIFGVHKEKMNELRQGEAEDHQHSSRIKIPTNKEYFWVAQGIDYSLFRNFDKKQNKYHKTLERSQETAPTK